MNYKLNITDNRMDIIGRYGKYRLEDGFIMSVDFGSFVNELNECGDTYIVEKGEVWKAPVKDFSGMKKFIQKCEESKLWNVMNGILYRVKIDAAKGILYIKGNTRNFVIGQDIKANAEIERDKEDSRELNDDIMWYIDETPNQTKHNYVESLEDVVIGIITGDEWWNRNEEEITDINTCDRGIFSITDGGNMKLRAKDKEVVIGSRSSGGLFAVINSENEHHVYERDTLQNILELI